MGEKTIPSSKFIVGSWAITGVDPKNFDGPCLGNAPTSKVRIVRIVRMVGAIRRRVSSSARTASTRDKAVAVATYARKILEGDKAARRGLYQKLGLPEDSSVK